jgi:hypothetical protein
MQKVTDKLHQEVIVRAVGAGQGCPHHGHQALGSVEPWRLRTQGDLKQWK